MLCAYSTPVEGRLHRVIFKVRAQLAHSRTLRENTPLYQLLHTHFVQVGDDLRQDQLMIQMINLMVCFLSCPSDRAARVALGSPFCIPPLGSPPCSGFAFEKGEAGPEAYSLPRAGHQPEGRLRRVRA